MYLGFLPSIINQITLFSLLLKDQLHHAALIREEDWLKRQCFTEQSGFPVFARLRQAYAIIFT